METSMHAAAVRLTEAALEGIGKSLTTSPIPNELLLTPLARIGDALRLGVDLPSGIRRWSDGLELEALQAAVASLIRETATWNFPDAKSGDPFLAGVLRRRDEAESVRLAVRRICLPRRIDPNSLTELAALDVVLSTVDDVIGTLVSGDEVATLLGARAPMDPRWADAFEAREQGVVEASCFTGQEKRVVASLQESVPSDEIVTRYITRGALSGYVEAVAAQNLAFADDLAACVDALLLARETVGLVARRWRARASASPSLAPLGFSSIPKPRLAAASGAEADAVTTTIDLGMLAPLDAAGRFLVSARELKLQVFEGNGGLQRVELGASVATAPTAQGFWELVVPASAGPVHLRVLATDGRELMEELHLESVPVSDEDG